MKHQRGQILLITLLALTIGVTVALSLIGRVTSDVAISMQSDETARAFSVAEAGLEVALRTGTASTGTIGTVSYRAVPSTIGGSTDTFAFPEPIPAGQTGTVWLIPHDGAGNPDLSGTAYSGNMNVCWDTGAVEVSVIYEGAPEYSVGRWSFDPQNGTNANNFATPTGNGSVCGNNGAFSGTFTVAAANKAILMRVKPYYATSRIWVKPDGMNFPTQGVRVEATGTTASNVERKIIVTRQFQSPLALMDYVLYSQGDVLTP